LLVLSTVICIVAIDRIAGGALENIDKSGTRIQVNGYRAALIGA
jgi:hypothetical protein